MVERATERQLRSSADVVTAAARFDASSGALAQGEALKSVGQTFFRLSQRALGQYERIRLADAEKRGKIAGAKATAKLPTGETLPAAPLDESGTKAAEAFNRGVLESFRARVTTEIIDTTARLEREFPDNPKGLATAFQGFFDGLRSAVPDELKPEIDLVAARNFVPARERAAEAFFKRENGRQQSAIHIDIQALQAEARTQAGELFHPDAGRAGAAAAALEGISAQISDRMELTDARGVPLFSEEAKRAEADRFIVDTVTVGARKALERADNKLGFIVDLDARLRSAGVRLTEGQFQAIEDNLLVDLNQQLGLEAALDARRERAFTDRQDANFRAMMARIARGDELVNRQEIQGLAADQLISPQQQATLLAAVESPTLVSNEDKVAELQVLAGSPAFEQRLQIHEEEIAAEDKRRLLTAHLAAVEQGGFLADQFVRQDREAIQLAFGVTGLAASLDFDRANRMGLWLQRHADAVAEAESRAEARQISREIVDQARQAEGQQRGLAERSRAAVLNPEGQVDIPATIADLDERLANGEISLEQFEEELERLAREGPSAEPAPKRSPSPRGRGGGVPQ